MSCRWREAGSCFPHANSPALKARRGRGFRGLSGRGREKLTRSRRDEKRALQHSWLVKQMSEWRIAVGNGRRIDAEALRDVLQKLEEAGLPAGLPGYVVLGSEWLFRLRDFGEPDIRAFLARLQRGLEPIVGSNAAHIVTEALEPGIRNRLRQHRQLAAVLEWGPPKRWPFAADPVEPPTEPLIPLRRGPAPWLAPWIAGLVVERLLDLKGLKGRPFGLDLVEVLRGDVDEKGFRVRRL